MSAVFCVIFSLLMFVVDATGDHIVEVYLSVGVVIVVYVTSIVPFCEYLVYLY